MLQEENRLSKIRDFNLLMSKGRWVKGPNSTLKVLKLAENKLYFPKKEDPEQFASQLKVAFAVGLKFSKKAVERNRTKRQLRETVRLLIKEGKVKPGYYLLLSAAPSLKVRNFAEISEEVKLLLVRANLLK